MWILGYQQSTTRVKIILKEIGRFTLKQVTGNSIEMYYGYGGWVDYINTMHSNFSKTFFSSEVLQQSTEYKWIICMLDS